MEQDLRKRLIILLEQYKLCFKITKNDKFKVPTVIDIVKYKPIQLYECIEIIEQLLRSKKESVQIMCASYECFVCNKTKHCTYERVALKIIPECYQYWKQQILNLNIFDLDHPPKNVLECIIQLEDGTKLYLNGKKINNGRGDSVYPRPEGLSKTKKSSLSTDLAGVKYEDILNRLQKLKSEITITKKTKNDISVNIKQKKIKISI